MASIRGLKRDLNNIMGEVIEMAMIWENNHPDDKHQEAEKIIQDAINSFDHFIAEINDRSKLERRAHLKQVRRDMMAKSEELVERVSKL